MAAARVRMYDFPSLHAQTQARTHARTLSLSHTQRVLSQSRSEPPGPPAASRFPQIPKSVCH